MKKSILAVIALLLAAALCGCNIALPLGNTGANVAAGDIVSSICIEKQGVVTIDDETGKSSYTTVYTHDEVIKRDDGLIEVRGTSTVDGGTTNKVRWLYTADGKQVARRTYENGSYSDYCAWLESTAEDYALYLDGVKSFDEHVIYFEDGAREVMNVKEYGLTENIRIYNEGEELPWLTINTEYIMLAV